MKIYLFFFFLQLEHGFRAIGDHIPTGNFQQMFFCFLSHFF